MENALMALFGAFTVVSFTVVALLIKGKYRE
jgi:hypothetical protein